MNLDDRFGGVSYKSSASASLLWGTPRRRAGVHHLVQAEARIDAMKDLILAIDQGTTGTTAVLMDRHVRPLAVRTVELVSHFPSPGRVEQEVDEIWASLETAVRAVLSGIDASRLAAVGITNQRETTLFWDTRSGAPAHRAIVWQDRRTADRCEGLRRAGEEERIRARTGLLLDPYFSATKAEWLLANVPGLRADASAGRRRFGTVDSYVVFRLTGEHVTDVSNASRTLLFDIHRLAWDDELCALFGVPPACLPRVVDSSGVVGLTRGVPFLPDGLPVAGIAGDQQAALFGQACFAPGMAKCTYGTGAFILVHTGAVPVASHHGLLTTVAWRRAGELAYALEGSAFVAGAAVQWLRDGLGFFSRAEEIEPLAASVPDSGGVVFVPALTGLGAPHWRPEARGLLWGITRGTTRAHVARAVLEGIALQVVDLLEAMERDGAHAITELRVDGGAARDDLLMQMQADLLRVACVRPLHLETTALGAGALAGLGAGLWSSTAELSAAWGEDRRFLPASDASAAREKRRLFAEAVAKA